MATTDELCASLSAKSEERHWQPWIELSWPDGLGEGWITSPEWISLYGTPDWDVLDEPTRRRLSLFEQVAQMSLVLHGERVLTEGVPRQLYVRASPEASRYLHHFLDEENRHMKMFGEFCLRYGGKVYTNKKLPTTAASSEDELDLRFHVTALVVEEIGLRYDLALAKDERLPTIVRDIHRLHHEDESRHVAFGRRQLTDLWAAVRPRWSEEQVAALQRWSASYLAVAWRDYYNADVYRDAGLPDPHAVRKRALASPVTREHRRKVSAPLVGFLASIGILADATTP